MRYAIAVSAIQQLANGTANIRTRAYVITAPDKYAAAREGNGLFIKESPPSQGWDGYCYNVAEIQDAEGATNA